MSKLPNVVVVIARCYHEKKNFGIRFEEKEHHQWVGTWAFAPKKELSVTKEGYDNNQISGSFWFDDGYPGCSYCHTRGVFKCGACNKLSCWDGEIKFVTCPWCGNQGELEGTIESLMARADQ